MRRALTSQISLSILIGSLMGDPSPRPPPWGLTRFILCGSGTVLQRFRRSGGDDRLRKCGGQSLWRKLGLPVVRPGSTARAGPDPWQFRSRAAAAAVPFGVLGPTAPASLP